MKKISIIASAALSLVLLTGCSTTPSANPVIPEHQTVVIDGVTTLIPTAPSDGDRQTVTEVELPEGFNTGRAETQPFTFVKKWSMSVSGEQAVSEGQLVYVVSPDTPNTLIVVTPQQQKSMNLTPAPSHLIQ
jgi:hypothetical protein